MKLLLNFPTHSLILSSSMLLKGLISTTKRRDVCNKGGDRGPILKIQSVLEGFLKIIYD